MENQLAKFQPSDVPYTLRQALAKRARQQTIQKYDAPAELFDQAERIVGAGYVTLTSRNSGHVYDPDSRLAVPPAKGSWGAVNSNFCAHCNDVGHPILCRHKLAVWFADLLARHAPQPDNDEPSSIARGGSQSTATAASTTSGAARGTLGHYHGGPPRQASQGRRSKNGKNCPYCGGFLDRNGGCNKATCPTNRGMRGGA